MHLKLGLIFFLISIFSLNLSELVFAEKEKTSDSGPEVEVVVGEGEIQLKVKGLDLSEAELEQLERELHFTDEISSLVLSTGQTRIQIQGEALKDLVRNLSKRRERTKTELKRILESELKQAQGTAPEESFLVSNGLSRVVMGQSITIPPGEHLDEFVVIGGEVEIFGSVDELVIIGGAVVLRPSAEVKKELVNLGGHLTTDPGARVKGKRNDLKFMLDDEVWENMGDRIFDHFHFQKQKWNDNWGLQFFLKALKFLVLILFFLLGEFFAPAFQESIRGRVRQNPFRSFFSGLVSLALVLPVTILLVMTIVGIPLLPLQYSLLVLFGIYGYVGTSIVLGRLIPLGTRTKLIVPLLFGFLFIELLHWVPYLGGFLFSLLLILGYGAANWSFFSFVMKSRRRLVSPKA